MKKRAGEVGKTSPAVLRWEPSELKKERTSFFAAGECWLGAIPTNVGKPAARDILHFLRAEARKKGGKWGENEKKSIEKGEKKHKKSCITLQCVV
jgi:hypothetical protein